MDNLKSLLQNLQSSPQINSILGLAQSAGLLDIAIQGFNAYKNGKLDVFVGYHYQNTPAFKKFFDENKDKTFAEFLEEKGINL